MWTLIRDCAFAQVSASSFGCYDYKNTETIAER